MNAMAPTRPAQLLRCRLQLPRDLAAPAQARRQVRETIARWDVPVEEDVAALLTSELMTNAIRHGTGESVMLAIGCPGGELRVDVYDDCDAWPVVVAAAAGAEGGRGLVLVATLSASWGCYRTPAGKAVYFTLAFGPG